MKLRTSIVASLAALLLAGAGFGCKSLKDITNALAGYQKIQFKLGDVNNFKVNGIDISRMNSVSDVGAMDMVRLGQMIAQKTLPVSFRLNVLAKNPNDGTNNTKSVPLYITRLGWKLSVDGRQTIDGVINRQIEVPGSGQEVTIPMDMQLDLYKFFGDRQLNDLLNLAMAIGGVSGSSSRLKLTANVRVKVPGLNTEVDYPGDITIVDTQFTNP